MCVCCIREVKRHDRHEGKQADRKEEEDSSKARSIMGDFLQFPMSFEKTPNPLFPEPSVGHFYPCKIRTSLRDFVFVWKVAGVFLS